MSGFSNTREIALRDVRERGRSKAYLLTSALTLVIVVGLVVVPTVVAGGTNEYEVGIVGDGGHDVVAAAIVIGNAGDEPGDDPSVAINTVEYPDREAGVAGLENGDVGALLVDGEEVVTRDAGGIGGSSLVHLLQRGAATVELEAIVARQSDTATEVIEIMTSDNLETSTLSGDEPESESTVVIAYVGLMLLYVAILLYGTWILTGVTEEKTNRVVEVLLAAVRPWQLLTGKVFGIGVLGLIQFGVTIVLAVIAIRVTGLFELPELPLVNALNLVLWFVLGFVIYAVLYGTAGALVNRMEDAQTAALPMTMVAVAGLFISISALDDPNGAVAVAGTLIPLTAPFVVPVRAVLDAISVWEYLVALVITVGSIALLIVLAGRIYAGGLLRFGGRVKVTEAWRSATE